MRQRIKNEDRHLRFYCLLAVLLFLIFLRYGLQINIPRIIYLFIIALIAAGASQTENIALCICLIPLHESVDFYYSIVICVVVYVLKHYRRIRINMAVILALVMVTWELLHCFDTELSLVLLVTSLVPIIALAIVMASDTSALDYSFIVRMLAFTTISICITMTVQVMYWSDFNIMVFLSNLRRLGMVTENAKGIAGGVIQTNSLGVICVLVTIGLLQLRSLGKNCRIDTLLIVSLLLFGTLTSSRTFLACLAMMTLLMILGQNGGLKKKVRFFLAIIAVFVAVLILMIIFFPDQLKYYIGRFSDSDITTGRDDLMINYHKFITQNPRVMFFGVGLQNYGVKLTEKYRVAINVPHNSIQEIIIAWGLPGLFLFALLIGMIIWISRKHAHRHILLNYIPLVIILFKSMAGQLLTSGYSMLTLSYAYLSLSQNFMIKEKK